MSLDAWVSSHKDDGFYQRIVDELTEETNALDNLVHSEKKYWEAFNRLNMLFLHLGSQITFDEVCARRYTACTVFSSLDWISKNKPLIDEIIQGIGGDGYGISTSNFGISISVSFGSGIIGIQSAGVPSKRTNDMGMSRALRPHSKAPSPDAMRSNVMNRNNPAFRASASNRSNQMNPNSPAYRSSRDGGRRK